MAGRRFFSNWLCRIRNLFLRILGWFCRIRNLFLRIPGRFRRIQWWYWRLADAWPISALWRYVKALFILFLWAGAAIGLFYLLRFLLPGIPMGSESTEGVSRESIALLGSLLTALIGFGLQQWKGQEEEEQRQHEEESRALCVVEEEFPDLLRKDLSEGARRYVEMRKKGGIWQHGRIRARLEEVWEREASPELRCAVAFIEKFSKTENFTLSEQIDALLWVYHYLDEDWRSRAADELLNRGVAFPEWSEKKWRAILGIWPEVTLGKGLSVPDRWIIQGLRYLGLGVNPFGAERAEMDAHLLRARAIPSWWEKLASLSAGLFFTVPGGGRTAAALLMAYDVLDKRTAFPVYCRVAAAGLSLADLARWTAQAMARYIALSPLSYMKCPHSAKQAMKRLLSGYLPTDPIAYLREVGLSPVGEGGKVLEEIRSYLADSSRPLLAPADLLTLFGEARPEDFSCTLILADVQGVTESEESILSLYALSDALARAGIIVQVFLATPSTTDLRKCGESLEWSEEDLEALLHNRLRLLSSDDSLDTWSDMRVWRGLSVEERLIAAAERTPRELIRKGNALLRHIGKTGRRLTPEDLDEVLGPVR